MSESNQLILQIVAITSAIALLVFVIFVVKRCPFLLWKAACIPQSGRVTVLSDSVPDPALQAGETSMELQEVPPSNEQSAL